MKTTLLLICSIAVLVMGCKFSQQQKATTAPPIQLSAEFPMLDSASVFDQDSLDAWHPSADAIVYARKVYLNAVDRWANQKDTKGSLPLFMRALRIAPEPVMYLRYAEALHSDQQYVSAYWAAGYVWHDSTLVPDAAMVTARCLVHMAQPPTPDSYQEELVTALSSGKFDVKEVAAYSDFDSVREDEDFKIIIAKYDFTNEQRKRALLGLFRCNFPQQGLPFAIIDDSLRTDSYRGIDFMFDDIIPDLGGVSAEFSRMTERSFQYVAELPSGPGFHTFVYRSVNYVTEEGLPPVNYYLMTVDTSGQNIDKIDLACACCPINIAIATIDTTGLIAVTSLRQTYRQDPLKVGYEGNEVVRQEPKGTKYYRINSHGKIEPQDKPGAATAVGEAPKAPAVLHWPVKEYNGYQN